MRLRGAAAPGVRPPGPCSPYLARLLCPGAKRGKSGRLGRARGCARGAFPQGTRGPRGLPIRAGRAAPATLSASTGTATGPLQALKGKLKSRPGTRPVLEALTWTGSPGAPGPPASWTTRGGASGARPKGFPAPTSEEPHLCAGGAWCRRRHQAGRRSWRACWPTPCRGPLRCSGSLGSATEGGWAVLSHPRPWGAGDSAPATCRDREVHGHSGPVWP